MAVSPEARGHGLATRFVKTGFDECRQRGIKELKILAAISIGPINKMYEKFGFRVATQIENHGIVSNVYVVPTDHFLKKDNSQ
jgi:ribosomal protein S18 acetylase RimI-like enzyme